MEPYFVLTRIQTNSNYSLKKQKRIQNHFKRGGKSMEKQVKEANFKRTMALIVMSIGVVLLLVGLLYNVPSDQLTTYSSLKSSYSYVESYINGDAYNFIIAGSLVGGRIAGTLALKGVLIAIGTLIICIGLINYIPEFKMGNASEDKKKEAPYVPIDENGIDLRRSDVYKEAEKKEDNEQIR